MTKSGLIEIVADRTPHISKKDTEIVVNTIFDSMANALQNGERIEIRGFGSFQVKVREARDGRNPKTGQPVHISAKRTPFFKVGKELKEMVDRVSVAQVATEEAAGRGVHHQFVSGCGQTCLQDRGHSGMDTESASPFSRHPHPA